MIKVATYGTFDLFHIGHLNLLKKCMELGDNLTVFVSTDEFNDLKGKKTYINYENRSEIVRNIRGVDSVYPETSWDQKIQDIKENEIDIFAIGDDWAGKFDFLSEYCEVIYLPRTDGISSTLLKENLKKGQFDCEE